MISEFKKYQQTEKLVAFIDVLGFKDLISDLTKNENTFKRIITTFQLTKWDSESSPSANCLSEIGVVGQFVPKSMISTM